MAEPIIEIWKPVVGWEGVYSVSDQGRVRRDVPGRTSRTTHAGRVLGYSPDKDGYAKVVLCHGINKKRHARVHILVAEAFLGARAKGAQVNHLNGIKNDNRLVNLEWATHRQNMRHSIDTLGCRQGSRHVNAKLTEEKVLEMRRLRAEGAQHRDLCARFGVSKALVSFICNRKLWTHV